MKSIKIVLSAPNQPTTERTFEIEPQKGEAISEINKLFPQNVKSFFSLINKITKSGMRKDLTWTLKINDANTQFTGGTLGMAYVRELFFEQLTGKSETRFDEKASAETVKEILAQTPISDAVLTKVDAYALIYDKDKALNSLGASKLTKLVEPTKKPRANREKDTKTTIKVEG